MEKKDVNKFFKIFGIIVAAFVAGSILEISNKIGQGVSPDSILTDLLGTFCKQIGNLPGSLDALSVCNFGFYALTTVLFVFSLIGIFKTSSEFGNIFKGLLAYAIGFGLGMLFIFLVL